MKEIRIHQTDGQPTSFTRTVVVGQESQASLPVPEVVMGEQDLRPIYPAGVPVPAQPPQQIRIAIVPPGGVAGSQPAQLHTIGQDPFSPAAPESDDALDVPAYSVPSGRQAAAAEPRPSPAAATTPETAAADPTKALRRVRFEFQDGSSLVGFYHRVIRADKMLVLVTDRSLSFIPWQYYPPNREGGFAVMVYDQSDRPTVVCLCHYAGMTFVDQQQDYTILLVEEEKAP